MANTANQIPKDLKIASNGNTNTISNRNYHSLLRSTTPEKGTTIE